MHHNPLFNLTTELLDENQIIKIKAKGSSMLPFFREGDEFVIKKAQIQKLKKGDLLIFEEQQTLIVHRLFKKLKNDQYVCWGDFNRAPDAVINQTQILAQVVNYERAGVIKQIDGFKHKLWCIFIIHFAPHSHHLMIFIAKTYLKIKRIAQIK